MTIKEGNTIFQLDSEVKFIVPIVDNGHQFCADWHNKIDKSIYPEENESKKPESYKGFTIYWDDKYGWSLIDRNGQWASGQRTKAKHRVTIHEILLSDELNKYNLL